MRLVGLLMLVLAIPAFGQNLPGSYVARLGDCLELRSDSTFKYTWSFDLASSWTRGRWKVSDKTVYLTIMTVYDTLTREDKPDSLVLSSDDRSDRIDAGEFIVAMISGGGQGRKMDRLPERLAIRGKRLYPLTKAGKMMKKGESGVWDTKQRPTYFYRVD